MGTRLAKTVAGNGIILILLGALISPAHTEFVSIPYTTRAIHWNEQFDEINKRLDITGKDAQTTKRMAAKWVAAGPCKVASIDSADAVRFVAEATGRHVFEIAVLAMISILQRDDLGRSSTEDVCRFATDIAK